MKKVLVFTATYNEAENIPALVDAVLSILPESEMLVVDDNSPDGTGPLLDRLSATIPRLHVVHRPRKNGLGTAHKIAMKYALAHGYEALVTMDADFSHDPSYLPRMMQELENADFVTGSRYVAGGSCEYPLSRVLLSRVANTLTHQLLGIPVHETTTAYRGFRRWLLERMNVDAIQSEGYSYFVEAIYQVALLSRAGTPPVRMAEFPIRFADRRAGSSKISKKEIWKGFSTLFRLSAKRATSFLAGGVAPPAPTTAPPSAAPCADCGSVFFTELVPPTVDSPGRAQCLGCGKLVERALAPGEDAARTRLDSNLSASAS